MKLISKTLQIIDEISFATYHDSNARVKIFRHKNMPEEQGNIGTF